jgi:hypothetical protein
LDSYFAYAIEGTSGTRETPTIALPMRSESLQDSGSQPIWRRGMKQGRRMNHSHGQTKSDVGGQVALDLTAEGSGPLLRACFGTNNTSGAGPYTHTMSRGYPLPTMSAQVGWDDDAGTAFRKDYIKLLVEGWSLSLQADQDPDFQVDLRAISEEKDAYTAVVPSYPTLTYFEFSDATVNVAGGGTQCFDTLSLEGRNNLYKSPSICPTNPTATEYLDHGMTNITGTLVYDFDGTWTDYDAFVAGTEASLVVALNAGANAQMTFTLNIVFTGETPQVTGPEMIKQPLPFEVTSATSDAAAATLVLINDDATI